MTAIRDSATQRALSRVLAGEPVRDAARAEGISPHNVYRARAHYEATGRRPQAPAPKPPRVDRRGPKPLKPAMARAVERVRSGETAQAAARAEGVDNSRLGRVCKRLGVPMRGRGKPLRDPAALARAVKRVLAGESAHVAAAAEGATRSTVEEHVKRIRKGRPTPVKRARPKRRRVDAVAIVDAAVARLREVAA